MNDDVSIGLLSPIYYKFYAHEVVEGMIEYAAEYPYLHIEDLRFSDIADVPKLLQRTRLDALIVGLTYHNYKTIGRYLPRKIPIVNLHPDIIRKDIPSVAMDIALTADAAVTYIHELGYRNVGYLCTSDSSYGAEMSNFLKESTARRCIPFFCFAHKPGPQHAHKGDEPPSKELDEWILSLPSSIGIIAGGGFTALFLSRSAKRLGICVPEELAIISLSDDDICLFADLPITSFRSVGIMVGKKALAAINDMLQGISLPYGRIIVPVSGIIERRSTGFAIGMPDSIKQAICYIRDHACDGITVDDVVCHTRNISRTNLYKQFNRYLWRSPSAEIFRVKIEQAKHLLRTTNLTITEIAYACGFCSHAHFSSSFSRSTGIPPTIFRRQNL